jgi:hypothetical protein
METVEKVWFWPCSVCRAEIPLTDVEADLCCKSLENRELDEVKILCYVCKEAIKPFFL